MKKILELRGVSVAYENSGASVGSDRKCKPALSNIDLTLTEGELLVIAGPNGSGKTTLLKTSGGLLAPLKGQVTVNGKKMGDLKHRERAAQTAFLFQVRENPWPFTVREIIAQGRFARRGWFGAESAEDREATEDALKKADLAGFAERPVTELSGGELQRVYIARCIAQGASFLLLDEPENNLDPKYTFLVLTLVKNLVKEGRGAMVSLHDLRLASRFAHRVALLSQDGGISALGSPHEVLTKEKLGKVYDISEELAQDLAL